MFLGNTNSPQPSCTTPYRSPGACGEQQWGCLAWHPQTIGPTPKVGVALWEELWSQKMHRTGDITHIKQNWSGDRQR